MNRLIVFTVALVFAFNVVVSQSETTDTTNDSSENLVSSTVEELYSTVNDVAKEQEEELEDAIGDMTKYLSKTTTDMSNIFEDIKNVGENNSDTVRNNLVDNLMSYVEDTEAMKQQIGRVMRLRGQFQNSILKQLYALPISEEDAKKLESDLLEQIQLRADSIPNIREMIPQIPNMPQMPKIPKQVSNCIPSFN